MKSVFSVVIGILFFIGLLGSTYTYGHEAHSYNSQNTQQNTANTMMNNGMNGSNQQTQNGMMNGNNNSASPQGFMPKNGQNGMMNGNGNMNMMRANSSQAGMRNRALKIISYKEFKKLNVIPNSGVIVDKKAKTIKFLSSKVVIPVVASPDEDNMYAFGVYGLINPIIVVKKGSVVTIELVNKDDDMYHAIMITKTPPPYNNMPMMMGSIAFRGAMIRPIPKKSDSGYYMDRTTFSPTTTGTYYYICQIPNHAAKGMFSKFIVTK